MKLNFNIQDLMKLGAVPAPVVPPVVPQAVPSHVADPVSAKPVFDPDAGEAPPSAAAPQAAPKAAPAQPVAQTPAPAPAATQVAPAAPAATGWQQHVQGAASGDTAALQALNESLAGAPPEQRAAARSALVAAKAAKQPTEWLDSGKVLKHFPGAHAVAQAVGAGQGLVASMKTPQETNDLLTQVRDQKASELSAALQGQAKQEWNDPKTGGWMNYLKQNPSLLLIPVGLMMAMGSRDNMGKILGILAAAGGAYNLHGRYKALQDPNFHAATLKREAGQASGSWTPEAEQQFQTQYGAAVKDSGAIQASGAVDINKYVGDQAKQMTSNLIDPPAPAAPVAAP